MARTFFLSSGAFFIPSIFTRPSSGKFSIVEKDPYEGNRVFAVAYEGWHSVRPSIRPLVESLTYALHLFHGDFARFLWHHRYQKATEKLVVDRRSKLINKLYIVSREQSLLMANYIASYLWINLYLCAGSRGDIMLP